MKLREQELSGRRGEGKTQKDLCKKKEEQPPQREKKKNAQSQGRRGLKVSCKRSRGTREESEGESHYNQILKRGTISNRWSTAK